MKLDPVDLCGRDARLDPGRPRQRGDRSWYSSEPSPGRTTIGPGLVVNPSGGLVARGHPFGATGLCQIVELADQLRDRAGARQAEGARLAAAVNTGGIIGGDAAGAGAQLLERR